LALRSKTVGRLDRASHLLNSRAQKHQYLTVDQIDSFMNGLTSRHSRVRALYLTAEWGPFHQIGMSCTNTTPLPHILALSYHFAFTNQSASSDNKCLFPNKV
jgi:hypothetical protein